MGYFRAQINATIWRCSVSLGYTAPKTHNPYLLPFKKLTGCNHAARRQPVFPLINCIYSCINPPLESSTDWPVLGKQKDRSSTSVYRLRGNVRIETLVLRPRS